MQRGQSRNLLSLRKGKKYKVTRTERKKEWEEEILQRWLRARSLRTL